MQGARWAPELVSASASGHGSVLLTDKSWYQQGPGGRARGWGAPDEELPTTGTTPLPVSPGEESLPLASQYDLTSAWLSGEQAQCDPMIAPLHSRAPPQLPLAITAQPGFTIPFYAAALQ